MSYVRMTFAAGAIKGTVLTLGLAVTCASVALGTQSQKREVPNEPDEPFTVYVYLAEGYTSGPFAMRQEDTGPFDNLRKLREEDFKEAFENQANWFKLLETREGAEIIVVVLKHEWSQRIRERDGSDWMHAIFTDVIVLGGRDKLTVNIHGNRSQLSMRYLASRLPLELEEWCKEHYWELAEKRAVRGSYAGFRKAVIEQNGARAVDLVDNSTISYYERIRELALHGREVDIRQLRIIDKLRVLMLRHEVPLLELEKMDARSLFAHAVDYGWVGQSVLSLDVGEIKTADDYVTGLINVGGRPTPFKLIFRNEEGMWRIDLTSIQSFTGAAMEKAIERSGRSEDDFLLNLLESVSGKNALGSIWQPLAKGPSNEVLLPHQPNRTNR